MCDGWLGRSHHTQINGWVYFHPFSDEQGIPE